MPSTRFALSGLASIALASLVLAAACSSSDDAETAGDASAADVVSSGDGSGPGPGPSADGGPSDGAIPSFDAAFEGGKVVACGPVPDSGGVSFTAVCSLEMPLSGPVSTTLDTSGCGQSASDTVTWKAIGGGVSYDVTAVFDTAVPIDVVGVFPLKSLEVVSHAAGGGKWMAGPHVCGLAITLSDCQPTRAHPTRHIISGTGSCGAALAPEVGTSAAALEVAPFKFLVQLLPP